MLSTLKDGIDNVVIQFDAAEPVFQAGKTITGKRSLTEWLIGICPKKSRHFPTLNGKISLEVAHSVERNNLQKVA